MKLRIEHEAPIRAIVVTEKLAPLRPKVLMDKEAANCTMSSKSIKPRAPPAAKAPLNADTKSLIFRSGPRPDARWASIIKRREAFAA